MSQLPTSRPAPSTAELGARLALIRWSMGWNQKEAALACGLPHASWRQWELMGSYPRNLPEVATKISDATGYDDYWIMTGRERGSSDGTEITHQYLPPFVQDVDANVPAQFASPDHWVDSAHQLAA